jgi:hypothetical protein
MQRDAVSRRGKLEGDDELLPNIRKITELIIARSLV